MQPVINNQPARINQQPEITQEPVKANFSNLSLNFIAAGTVANFVTKDNADKLPVPNILQRQVQTLVEFKSHHIVQQLINKITNAFDARDYETLQTFFESGCCKLTEDQLETLVQENISKSDSYALEEGEEKFITIACAIKDCISWGAKVTQEQLDNCLEKAISVIDGSAIRLLLRLGATRPSMESLNQLLQYYLDPNVEIDIRLWKDIMGALPENVTNLLDQKLQEAINNGDYITICKTNGLLNTNLAPDQLNQVFKATFENGYTDSKQLEYLLYWIADGAIADDTQIDLLTKEIINQKTLYTELPRRHFYPQTNVSQKIDTLCKFVNVDPSSTISEDQTSNSEYLLRLIIGDVTNDKKITNDEVETCIQKSLDLGCAFATNFFLKANNCNKELTKEQLDYGLQQNLKLFQSTYDVRKWLSMGSSVQVFEQYFEESLKGDDLIKILNLLSVSYEIEQLNHIVKDQRYIDAAVDKGISQLKSVNVLEARDSTGFSLSQVKFDLFDSDDLFDPDNLDYTLIFSLNPMVCTSHATIPGYFISMLLKNTSPYRNIKQRNEKLTLLLETAIDKLEFKTISRVVQNMNYELTDEQIDKIKQKIISQGIPEYMRADPPILNNDGVNILVSANILEQLKNLNLNITFTQEELNTGYAKALQDSHSTFDIWKSFGAKPIFEKTDQ
jgi:hypothetical protein